MHAQSLADEEGIIATPDVLPCRTGKLTKVQGSLFKDLRTPFTQMNPYRGAQAARETRLQAGVATTFCGPGPRIRFCSAGDFAAFAGTRCTAPRYAGCGCSATPGAQRTGTTRAVALLTRPRPCGGFEPSAPAGSCDTGRPATEGRRQRRGATGRRQQRGVAGGHVRARGGVTIRGVELYIT
jgi:hypothetical protein